MTIDPLSLNIRQPSEVVVHDEAEPCPYLDGRTARLPLRWQMQQLTPAAFDRSLAKGDRRVNRMLYRTACPECQACEAIRIPIADFELSKSQRRTLNRNRDLVVEARPATFSEEKLDLYNRHKIERSLDKGEGPLTADQYNAWFLESCARTYDVTYHLDGRLVGLSILDVGQRDASSVYFCFDPSPELDRRSLGVFSVLMEMDWLLGQGGRYYYLGLYIEACRPMTYKRRFTPHERLIEGEWRRFDL